jgi:lipopolysaccharide assembly protein A
MSAAWTASICAAVLAILLIIFILENGKKVEISYMGVTGHLPLGVALLVAAAAGALLVGILGMARLTQLRLLARRHRRRHAQAQEQVTAADSPAAPSGQLPG